MKNFTQFSNVRQKKLKMSSNLKSSQVENQSPASELWLEGRELGRAATDA